MTIDPLVEPPLPFAEISKLFPPGRHGKRPSISCIYRWSTCGCRGVVLETIQMGGRRVSSAEAVRRFCERLTSKDRPTPATAAPNAKAVAKAQAFLDREGV